MTDKEGVKMVTYKCPVCGAKVRVISTTVGGTCDNQGKHRQAKMERVGK